MFLRFARCPSLFLSNEHTLRLPCFCFPMLITQACRSSAIVKSCTRNFNGMENEIFIFIR